ncbi:MAG: ABC transporter permease [Sulfuricurvum sp. PC08-66]|nr:MAG: ABC transporter permease [Sulfuricurvum sp. PC08-66]
MYMIRYFLPYFKEYKFTFFLVFLGVIGSAIGTVGVAEILKRTIDEILVAKNVTMLYIVPMGLVALYIIKGVGRYVQAYFTNYIGQDIVRQLRERLLAHMMHLDMLFFTNSRSGELISRLSNDIARIQYVVARIIPELLRDAIVVIGLTVYAISLNPTLAFYALVVLPTTVIPLAWLARRMKRISHLSQEKNADVTSRLTEVFNNIEIIKANTTETIELERFAKENNAFFKINMKGVRTFEFVSPMMEIFGAFGIATILIVGGMAVIDGTMTQGELFAFLTAVGMLYDPIRKSAELLNQMQDGVAATQRVSKVFDEQSTMHDGSHTLDAPIQTITFEGVGLSYGDKVALHDINLTMQKGQIIALVGDSGGGKSSLVNLILRFYDPTQGTITFNGIDIKTLDIKSLRQHTAIVSQRVYIFQDSLGANVAYGNSYDEAQIYSALAAADATKFVEALPQGIDTTLDEFGANLSGGQRQRIAIARALYKNADILILDEATSALDNQSEKRIQEALESLTRDKFTFIIAHRLSTIEHAHTILLFKEGRIIDRGTHQELLSKSDEYRRLAGSFE